jgi:Zn-dependent protease
VTPRSRHPFAVRLGRVAGIDVYVDLSALVIVVLIGSSVALGLRTIEEGYSAVAYWSVGIATSLLFLGSLLAHELSHSVVARRRGIEVRDITLWLLGGVATIETEPKTAGDELAIAAAGPLTSAAIGVALTVAGATAATISMPDLVVAAMYWLGTMNLILAVFNVVPAAPLDGGRLLTAFLWRRTGDRLRARRAASRGGEIFAWFLFGVGVLELLLGAGISGVWAVLLGWFVRNAAAAEAAQAEAEERLAGRRVVELMTPRPVVAPDDITVDDLLDRYVIAHHCTSFPVSHNGRISGLATLARCRALNPSKRSGVLVRDVAWPLDDVTTARPDELIIDVLERASGGDGRILVFDGPELVGIVSPSDISRVLEAVR